VSPSGEVVVDATLDAAKRLAIRDAATLVMIDTEGAAPRLLMGRRRDDLAFLAGKYVFPGGRVDPSDKAAPAASELPTRETERLCRNMRGRPTPLRARALAIAAVRELHEETGLVFGAPGRPPLGHLTFFARAITPPGRPRRYDTRFFMASARALTSTTLAGDGELRDLAWLSVDEARGLDLPRITTMILDDIEARVTCGHAEWDGAAEPIPFYRHRAGQFRRDLLWDVAGSRRLDRSEPSSRA
jgi:8-oxo-dGTP pyrophosphatase MutT (NUDIX family)